MEDEVKDDKATVRELQEEQLRLKSLVDHPGFKYLQEVLEAQVKTRQNTILLTPLKAMDGVLEQEYQKGEAAGIQFAANFALVRLAVVAEQIDELLKPKEGQGNENDVRDE